MRKIIISILLICSFSGWAATYHFANAGNDATGNGSITSPYATMSKVESLNFSAGDSILFKRGDTFISTEIVYVEGGNVGTPIIISAYGTGAKPIITGMGDVPGWNVSGNWTNSSGNIWYIQLAATYSFNRLWINGIEAVRIPVANNLDVTSTNIWNYHWSDKLYVYSTTNPATAFSSMKGNLIGKLFHCDYGNIIFYDLDLQASNACIRLTNGADNFIFDSCNIGWNSGGRGIDASNSLDTLSNILIKNCVFDSNDTIEYIGYEAQASFAGIDAKLGIKNWEIKDCYFKNWGHSAIDFEGLTGTSVDNVLIHDNYFTAPDVYYGRAIGFMTAIGTGSMIYNNYSFDCPTTTQINGGATKIYNNVFDNNHRESLIIAKPYITGSALAISNSDNAISLAGMEIYNNVLANAFDCGFDFGGYDGSPNMDSVLFINNILYNNGSSARSNNYQLIIYEQVSMDGNTFKNNLFYKSGITDVIYYGNDATNDYPHTVAEFNAENGNDGDIISANLQLDPLFISTTNFNLQSTSPAINVGVNVGLPYKESFPDMGAYEYNLQLGGIECFMVK